MPSAASASAAFTASGGIAAVLLMGLYFMIPDSRVKGVTFRGNQYLSSRYLQEISGVKEGNLFYLPLPWVIEQKVSSDPFVESCDVQLLKGNIVKGLNLHFAHLIDLGDVLKFYECHVKLR